jgi:flagellar biosynthetic protein FliR
MPSVSPFSWVPVVVRLPLLLAVAYLTVAASGAHPPALPGSQVEMGVLLMSEMLLGLALAFSVHLTFGVLHFFGRLVDMQMGIGAAGIFNPAIGNTDTLVGTALGLLGTLLFFVTGAYLTLFRGLAASLEAAPLGHGFMLRGSDWLLDMLSNQFLLGFTLVAPVVIALLLLDITIAFSSRMMPQANIYFVSLPLKIGIGMLCLSVSLRFIGPAMGRLFASGFNPWQRILGS